jgi:hypothetical protein
MAMPCNIVQEYVMPPNVTAVRIEAESHGSSGHSTSAITLQIHPDAIFRLRLTCLPAQKSSEIPQAPPD